MSRASHIVTLLSRITYNEVEALTPADRRLLRDELERVHRMVTGATIMCDARTATAHEGESNRTEAAFFEELRDGRGRD